MNTQYEHARVGYAYVKDHSAYLVVLVTDEFVYYAQVTRNGVLCTVLFLRHDRWRACTSDAQCIHIDEYRAQLQTLNELKGT